RRGTGAVAALERDPQGAGRPAGLTWLSAFDSSTLRLPSVPDLEPRKLAGRFEPLFGDPADPCPRWPLPAPGQKLLQHRLGPFGQNLHRPVGAVAHPAAQPQTPGRALGRPAKGNPLDQPPNRQVKPPLHASTPSRKKELDKLARRFYFFVETSSIENSKPAQR